MADKIDAKEMVTTEELLMAQMIQIDVFMRKDDILEILEHLSYIMECILIDANGEAKSELFSLAENVRNKVDKKTVPQGILIKIEEAARNFQGQNRRTAVSQISSLSRSLWAQYLATDKAASPPSNEKAVKLTPVDSEKKRTVNDTVEPSSARTIFAWIVGLSALMLGYNLIGILPMLIGFPQEHVLFLWTLAPFIIVSIRTGMAVRTGELNGGVSRKGNIWTLCLIVFCIAISFWVILTQIVMNALPEGVSWLICIVMSILFYYLGYLLIKKFDPFTKYGLLDDPEMEKEC